MGNLANSEDPDDTPVQQEDIYLNTGSQSEQDQ